MPLHTRINRQLAHEFARHIVETAEPNCVAAISDYGRYLATGLFKRGVFGGFYGALTNINYEALDNHLLNLPVEARLEFENELATAVYTATKS